MNTLACIGAAIATLWLTVWFFETGQEPSLGFVGLAVFLLFLVFTILSAMDDLEQLQSGRRRKP